MHERLSDVNKGYSFTHLIMYDTQYGGTINMQHCLG